ncbi:RimK family alpha-L-glutamate ligase [Fictibacillus macauensis ZFHKF-1]|uniref:RimK family alpha-L-glutamate ligase n=1 Tax=Fictibacillus macauensis ZFHKF-1 TaxID=1196324 RepID=I8UEV1_9BACL|nr:RimK family alpha-L-glutamate ligase [Fictibacillus macauensis]EIT85348.1 RimK family alpha-L-glutamate ligase [Fictibacillus macauensis ZFHKF-1]
MKPSMCWIIYNGNLNSAKFTDFAQWMARAAEDAGITPILIKNNELLPLLHERKLLLAGKETELPAFVIFGDKDLFLARQLELLGIPVYNSAETIERCDHKGKMYQALAAQGLPLPKTIIAPKIFHTLSNDDHLALFTAHLSFPLVIKEAYGSFGMQVYLVHNETELREKVAALGATEYIVQEMITSSWGKDIRLNVVGGQVIAAMQRSSETDFRANITAGGRSMPYDPSDEEVALAIACASAVNAAFAGVDLLFGPDGSPIVCEINSNAHIRSIYECTQIDVAPAMIAHIQSDLARRNGMIG